MEKCLRPVPTPPTLNPRGSSWRRSALSMAAMCRPCADLAAHAMNFAALGQRAHCKTGQEPTVAAVLRPRVLCASGTPVICSSKALRLRLPLVSEILRIFCAVHRAEGPRVLFRGSGSPVDAFFVAPGTLRVFRSAWLTDAKCPRSPRSVLTASRARVWQAAQAGQVCQATKPCFH